MLESQLLFEFSQFFWHAEFYEFDEILPFDQVHLDDWLGLIDSQSSSLRAVSLAHLNAWILDAVRDFNVPVIRQRCLQIWALAESGVFSESLTVILQTSDSSQSAQTRHLLNVVFIGLHFCELPDFHATIVANFHRLVEIQGMPIRKFLKILEHGISQVSCLPEYALFADKSEIEKFPASHPKLTTFRSFVLLGKHHHSLVSVHPAPPPAIRQACAIIETWYGNFFTNYRMHAVEIEYMRTEPTMHEAFVCFARHKNRATARPKLFEDCDSTDTQLFSPQELLRSFAQTPLQTSDANAAGAPRLDEGEDGNSECSEVSVSADLLRELREISDENFPYELLQDISSWFSKISDHKTDYTPVSFEEPSDSAEETNRWMHWTTSLIGILLRLKLSACKHSAEYPHALPIDQDRLLLHATLETRRNTKAYELAKISAETELRKNADIIANTISGIFLRALQFPGVGSSLVAHNGLLVFLKYANGFEDQELSSSSEVPAKCNSTADGLMATFANSSRSFVAAFPSVKITGLYRSLQLIWKLVKDHPARVRKYILPFRSVTIMKRLMRCSSYRVQRVVLKLFKVQVRFLPKKLKNFNIKFVSQVFVHSNLTTDVYDDWMLTTALTVDQQGQEDAAGVAVHQGPESAAGAAEREEELFEVRDGDTEGELERNGMWSDLSVEDLKDIDWEDEVEVKNFCDTYGVSTSRVFFGYSNFNDWLHQEVLLQRPSLQLPLTETLY